MSEDFLKNPLSLFDVKGKTALITGATGAFGALAAQVLAGAGCNLVLAAGENLLRAGRRAYRDRRRQGDGDPGGRQLLHRSEREPRDRQPRQRSLHHRGGCGAGEITHMSSSAPADDPVIAAAEELAAAPAITGSSAFADDDINVISPARPPPQSCRPRGRG